LDFSVAQQIAIDLHHDWLFKPLDGGDCIDLIDDVTPITYGSANFFGLAHGKSMEDLINYEPFGIIHTGQIGDSIIGTFFKKNAFNPEYKLGQSAYSIELIERLSDYQIQEDYKNEEIFCLYTRAFTGANQGLLTFQENSESCSPFIDVDFLEYCYKIPLKLRYGHRIYFDWILEKYPEAAEYVWEHTGEKIKPFEKKDLKYAELMGKRIPVPGNPEFLRWLKGSILRRLGLRKQGEKPKAIVLASKNNMNPVDYWYRTNPHLKEFMDNYWEDNKYLIPEGQLKEDMTHLYKDCVLYDKLQCLSVLSAMKLILS
jgi:asparagine synthase (glutamine-hydrolysing)